MVEESKEQTRRTGQIILNLVQKTPEVDGSWLLLLMGT
jgi:hypothetical protein